MDVINFIILVATCINALISITVFIRYPKTESSKYFLLTAIAISFWCFSMIFYRLAPAESSLSWAILLYFFPTLTPLGYLLFGLSFPNEKIKKTTLASLIIFNSLLGIIILIPGWVIKDVLVIPGQEKTIIFGWAYPGYVAYYNIFFPLCYLVYLRKYKQLTGVHKQQIMIILISLLFTSIPALFTNLIFPTLGNFRFNWFGQVGTFFWIGGVAYAIVRHRFFDIRLIVARALAYLSLLVFIGLGYIAFLFNIAVLINNDEPSIETFRSLIIPAVIALFFAISFQPLKKFFERITDKIFYKDKYDSQELLWSLSRIMASTLNLSHLSQQILNKLLNDMKVSYGSIVLIRNTSVIWVGSAGQTIGHPFKGSEIFQLIEKSNKQHSKGEHLLIYEEMEDSSIKAIMREHEVSIVLPLVVRDELIGGLSLGQKASGEMYSSEDIDVLKILAPEIAVAVKNALSFDEIKRFNVTLEEEIHRATDRLRRANQRLKELDTLKDEFVSIASHELRTPMTAIKSYLWMAINQPGQRIKAPLDQYLKVSYNSTERLIHLVNDMLTVSRIERNKVELKKEDIDVFGILQQVYEELKVTAEEKKIQFTLKGKDGAPYFVNGDKEKLREVFQNIIGNALKFTPSSGKIQTTITKDKSDIYIAFSDTGPGIHKEAMKDLFKKFSKIEYSYAKHSNQPGTGLGLYISKQIVSLHGGDIRVESEVNVGTTFTVVLPQIKKGKEAESK